MREGTDDRIVAIETKGEQLAGNHDTEYKRALLSLLSEKFDAMPQPGGSLDMAGDAFDFRAALVLFGELSATLPGVIRAVRIAPNGPRRTPLNVHGLFAMLVRG